MAREVQRVHRGKPDKARGGVDAKQVPLGLAKVRMKQRIARVGETDLPSVEGGVPERRDEQVVVDVELLGVGVAFGRTRRSSDNDGSADRARWAMGSNIFRMETRGWRKEPERYRCDYAAC